MFREYFNAAEEYLNSIGKSPVIRAGQPVSETQLNEVERIIGRPIPTELRIYFREMGDGYSFSPAQDQEGLMIGWLGDYRYKVAGFVDAIREEVALAGICRNAPEVVARELLRRERWFPFYNFGGGGYMFCIDLNESPSPICYYERVYWPNDSPDTWGFRAADSFLDMVRQWSRFCFADMMNDNLINFASGASGRFDWAPSRFDVTYDRGTTQA
jgi:SMI1 / KNR4 family (SUKH-1)